MSHYTIAQVALVVVRHPGIYIARLSAELPALAQVVPRYNTTKGVLALPIIKVGILAVVYSKHCQLADRVDIPRVETKSVASACVVVDLLE